MTDFDITRKMAHPFAQTALQEVGCPAAGAHADEIVLGQVLPTQPFFRRERMIRDYVRLVGGVEEAPTLGDGSMRAPSHLAALANGVAGHALDWDDTALPQESDRSVLIYPTVHPLSACYALAESHNVTGREFLTAFILGFEDQVKIAEAINPEHFTGGRGFNSTGTIGVFGAARAAGELMRLDAQSMRNALAIAATMSAGLGVNHGTMCKPLDMGRAAETGITASRLASLGFDGPANALEGGRGLFEAFGGGFAPKKNIGSARQSICDYRAG